MHFFLTGATGFLGRHVVGYLLEGGHGVTALISDRDVARSLADHGVRPHVGVVADKEVMRRGMRGVDGVFHLAGHRQRIGDRRTAEAVHLDGTRNVFELVAELLIPRVVHTSGISVLVDATTGVEGPVGRHLTRHDRLRARAHLEIAQPAMRKGVPGIIVLPGALYGPGDRSGTSWLVHRYLVGRVRFASDAATYSWAHVEDVARAHVLAMEFGRVGASYVLGGEEASVHRVLSLVGRLVGREAPFRMPVRPTRVVSTLLRGLSWVIPPLRGVAERLRVTSGARYVADDSVARSELGFDPRPLEAGLSETVQWMLRERFERI